MQQSNVIEVVHGTDCDGHYYWTVKTDETHDCGISYPAGYERPHYPVPAIPLRAVWGTDCMWDTVYLERPCENDPVIVSICDMNFDRCLDFDTPWCEFYQP